MGSPARSLLAFDTSRPSSEGSGGAISRQFYLAMGKYDLVIIAEAPDDEAAARVTLSLGALGNVRTETLRVFDEGEFRKIVGSLK